MTEKKVSRLELIPPRALEEVGFVMGYGATIHGEQSYLRGADWMQLVGSMERHIQRFKAGHDVDGRSGCLELGHVAAKALMIMEMMLLNIGDDTRWTPDHLTTAPQTKTMTTSVPCATNYLGVTEIVK